MSFATVSNCIVLREVVYGRSRNMIAETINTAAPRHYLWGLDISGTGQGAGGVGGQRVVGFRKR